MLTASAETASRGEQSTPSTFRVFTVKGRRSQIQEVTFGNATVSMIHLFGPQSCYDNCPLQEMQIHMLCSCYLDHLFPL